MRWDFWKGIIAGSLLGAVISMLIGIPEQKEKRAFLGKIYARRPKTKTQQLIRGITRTVGVLK